MASQTWDNASFIPAIALLNGSPWWADATGSGEVENIGKLLEGVEKCFMLVIMEVRMSKCSPSRDL